MVTLTARIGVSFLTVTRFGSSTEREIVRMSSLDLPLANIVTLGVLDIEAQRDFYRSLGWHEIFDLDGFVVFELRGVLLGLFPIEKLAQDANASPEPHQGGIRCSVGINVDTPAEVDALAQRVTQAGGRLTKAPTEAEFFEGRDAYFSDPEGNYWEIVWASPDNPVLAAARRAAGIA
jgi:predicted lactoylglutathione lyase